MVKIIDGQSREIYNIAKNPQNKLTNQQIADKFGISETNVRYHIAKNEKCFSEIAKNNEKVNSAVAKNTLDVIAESLMQISNIKSSIQQARNQGVSPERLSGLFNNWIRALELSSELLGDLDRTPIVNVQITSQMNELTAIIAGEQCPTCKAQKIGRLHEIAGK